MKIVQLIFLLTVCIVCNFFANSQVAVVGYKRCPVKTINFEQGLINNGTTDVITDALGFTWISATTGMQRYNGYVLETVNPVINHERISINSPVHFFSLNNGVIWISYRDGVLSYDPQTNSFRKIIATQQNNELNFSIIPVKETSEGIWCLHYKQGLIVYSSQNGRAVKKISGNNTFIQHVFDQPVALNNTNFTTNSNSIFTYNGKDSVQKINTVTKEISYINADNITCFCCSNTLLYSVSANNIISINISNRKIEKTISIKKFTKESITYESCFLNENNQLLISINTHLFEFDTSCNYKNEFTNLNRNAVVPVGFIRIIYADKFKRIWLLTNDDIKRVQNFTIPFEHLMYTDAKNNFIRSMYYDEQQHVLLAGCYNGGIQLYDSSGNALWQKSVSTDKVKDVNGIEKLGNDDYLITTMGRGLYILNLSSKKISPLIQNKKTGFINASTINFSNNIQRINDSVILIGTATNIYYSIFKKSKLVVAKPLLAQNRNAIDQLYCFLYAQNKTLWAGTATGKIFKMDTAGNISIIHIPGNYFVRSLTEDIQHNVWAGTDKGLYVFDKSGSLIKTFTSTSGLLNDCIYAMLPVKNKTAVFASSNLGLSYISFDENIVNYTKESGLQENEFNTQSAVRTTKGKYYFGGINGITSFYPSSLVSVQDTPVLNIAKLIINDVPYNSSPGVLKGDSIKLNYTQNHIQLDFAALGLLNTNEYVYTYRLLDFESTWQTAHEPTGIKYVLEPGNYLFEINCTPVFYSRNIFKRSIVIIVSPPFWQTWWFKILIVLISVSVVVFIVRQYLNKRYRKKLNALKLSHEIQQERERISRDLHDNLGAYAAAIASNVSTLHEKNAADKIVLQQLTGNSQSIIQQLNDTIWALKKEAIALTAISDRFKIFLQKIQPNYPNINVTIQENILNDETLSPVHALHLFRIMQEAVNNALRHSGCSEITIIINSNNAWNVIIKDDGKGFLDLNEKLVKGNGLKNIQQRGEEAGWEINWTNASPKGTKLIISSAYEKH